MIGKILSGRIKGVSIMKHIFSIITAVVFLLAFTVPASAASTSSQTIPTFSIVSVVQDKTVTIQTANFPANDTFTVTMGKIGTLGIGGIVVGTTDSGSGGSFQATYNIPASLAGLEQIAIRLQSSTSGYFAYNWFYNNTATVASTPSPTTTPAPATSGYSGFPTFTISSVVQDQSVTILTSNLPPNDTFTVTMGKFGTEGVGGMVVGTTSSGNGGSLTETYTIPSELAGMSMIAIRLQSPTTGYFAYNWFYNNTATVTPAPSPTPTPSPASSGYTGLPTFTIAAVVMDKTVTISGINFPANDTFNVFMGVYGSLGIGGIDVGSTSTGAGGALSATYNIPSSLAGSSKIAIRLQSPTSGYFAYNWFNNNTATVATP
jgi:hypothetical protein